MGPTRETPKATRGEVALLVGIVVLAAVAFSPFIINATVGGISALAWMLWFIMCGSPVVGLVLAIRSKED